LASELAGMAKRDSHARKAKARLRIAPNAGRDVSVPGAELPRTAVFEEASRFHGELTTMAPPRIWEAPITPTARTRRLRTEALSSWSTKSLARF
jgi:hypothetical protein